MTGMSEDAEMHDTFDEVLRDRIVLHLSHLHGDDLLRVSGLCIELRVRSGSLPRVQANAGSD